MIKRNVTKMDNEAKIEKILKQNKLIHLILFILSVAMIAYSSVPNFISQEINIIMKLISIAFFLMIILNYNMRKLD